MPGHKEIPRKVIDDKLARKGTSGLLGGGKGMHNGIFWETVWLDTEN